MALFAYCRVEYQTIIVEVLADVNTLDVFDNDFITGDLGSPSIFVNNGLAITDTGQGTTLTVNASGTTWTIVSNAGITDGDHIAIELDVAASAGTHFWTRVVSSTATTVTVEDAAPSAATSGNQVVTAGQLATTSDFTVFEDFKRQKALTFFAKSGLLREGFVLYQNNEFDPTTINFADIAAYLSASKDPSQYTITTVEGRGYTFADEADALTLLDLLSVSNSTINTGQESLLSSVSSAVNSQAAMDAIVDSRTKPVPVGTGLFKPPVRYDTISKDSFGLQASSGTTPTTFEFRNSVGTRQANLDYNHNTNEFLLEMRNAGDFIIRHFLAGDMFLSAASIQFDGIASNAATPFTFTNTGANGGSIRMGAGTVTPEAAVTNTGAGVYVLEDGVDSALFFKTTASGNTGWQNISANAVTTFTSSTAIATNDDFIRIDATAATRDLTLPDASLVPLGKEYTFRLSAIASTFYGSFAPFAGDSINGATTERRLGSFSDTVSIIKVSDTAWDIKHANRRGVAEMSHTGGSTAQGSIGATPLVITAFNNNVESTNGVVTADQANNEFDVTHVEGTSDNYLFTGSLSLEFDNNVDAILEVFVNGVATGINAQFNGTGSGDAHNIALVGTFNVTTAGHDVDVRINAASGASNTATYISAHATIGRIR